MGKTKRVGDKAEIPLTKQNTTNQPKKEKATNEGNMQ